MSAADTAAAPDDASGDASDDASSGPAGDKRPRAPGTVGAYWRLAGGFWSGATGLRAWLLTMAVAVLVIANICVTYGAKSAEANCNGLRQ